MITLQMQLWPRNSRALRTPLIFARIWTDVAWDNGRPIHGYVIHDADNRVIARGRVPKERSRHRNPLRLLQRILASIDLDALPNDHVETVWGRLPGAEADAAISLLRHHTVDPCFRRPRIASTS